MVGRNMIIMSVRELKRLKLIQSAMDRKKDDAEERFEAAGTQRTPGKAVSEDGAGERG
jgi:hypothetical protein